MDAVLISGEDVSKKETLSQLASKHSKSIGEEALNNILIELRNIGLVKNDPTNAQSGSYYWKDGSTGAEDYLYHYFSTTIGLKYRISFYLKGAGGLPNSARVYIGP